MSVWRRGDLVRLKDSNKEALIRYIGPVLFRDDAEIVYGIELVGEHSQTGEHDGKVKGVRYFISAPTAGTFVTASQIKCALTSADFRLSDRLEKKLARVLALKEKPSVTVEDEEYELSLPPISATDTSDDSSPITRPRSSTPGPGSSGGLRRTGRSNSTLPSSTRERSKRSVGSSELETVTDESISNDLTTPSKPAKRRRKSFSPGMVGDERTVTTSVRSPSSVDRKLGPRDIKLDFTNWSPPDYDLKREESDRGFLEPRFRRRRDRSKSGITVSSSPRSRSAGATKSKEQTDGKDTLKKVKVKSKRRRSASGTITKGSTRPIPKFKAGGSGVQSKPRKKSGSVTTKDSTVEFVFEEKDEPSEVVGSGFQSPDLSTQTGTDELFGIATESMEIGMIRARTAPMVEDSPPTPPVKKHQGTDSEGSALISKRRTSAHFRNVQSEDLPLKSAASETKNDRSTSSKSPGRTRRSGSSGTSSASSSTTNTGGKRRRSSTKTRGSGKRLSGTGKTTGLPLKRRSLTSTGSKKRKSGSRKSTGVAYQSNIAPKRAMERGKRDRELLRKKAAEQEKLREERKKAAAARKAARQVTSGSKKKLVFKPKGGTASADPKSVKKKKPSTDDGKKGSKKKGKHSKKRSDPSKRKRSGSKKKTDGNDSTPKKKRKKTGTKKKKKGTGKKKKSDTDGSKSTDTGTTTATDTSSSVEKKTSEEDEKTDTQSTEEIKKTDSDVSLPDQDPISDTESQSGKDVSAESTTEAGSPSVEASEESSPSYETDGGGSGVDGGNDAEYGADEDYSAEMIDQFDESEAWRFPELRGKDIRFTRIDSMLRGIEKAGDQPAAQLKITIAPVDLVPASTTAVAMAAMAAVAARSSGDGDDDDYDSESSYETDSSYESSSYMSSSDEYGDENDQYADPDDDYYENELEESDSSGSLIRTSHSRSDTMEELRKQLMEMRMETDVIGMAWTTVSEETRAESAAKHGSSSSAKIDEILDEDEFDSMSAASGAKRSSMFSFGSSDLRNSLFGDDDLSARIGAIRLDDKID